jgi:hypothetical protein
MTSCSKLLNTVGLALVLVGCVLLYLFGLPAAFNPEGKSFIQLENDSKADIDKGKRYRSWGRLGIALVGLGTVFQIAATWM